MDFKQTSERPGLSVIIPCRNGAATIGLCLEAIQASDPCRCEIVVVDDGSSDGTCEIASLFPCRLVRLDSCRGAAVARNRGAEAARADIFFFTDADCLVLPDTLPRALEQATRSGPDVALGGTYTPEPADGGFFSRFQSVFINHSETKRPSDPDYLATHALVIHRATFRRTGGFAEGFLPILEDVEYSHRLRRRGVGMRMLPGLFVRHLFGYTLGDSLRNAVRKARFWTRYSLENRDITADSGTASRELKVNVVLMAAAASAVAAGLAFGSPVPLVFGGLGLGLNLALQRRILGRYRRVGGTGFALKAAAYYMTLYAVAVGVGAGAGFLQHVSDRFRGIALGRPSPGAFSPRSTGGSR